MTNILIFQMLAATAKVRYSEDIIPLEIKSPSL